MARERLERTVRVEADIRTQGDQRLEVRGVGTEIYHDAKRTAAAIPSVLFRLLVWLVISVIGVLVTCFVFWFSVMQVWTGSLAGIVVGCLGFVCAAAWVMFVRWLITRVLA